MRKLKLQMQVSADGYCAGPNGELDWMTWTWDDKLEAYGSKLTESIDTILLGRKMADGFISHWAKVAVDTKNREAHFAKQMVDAHKVVFTKTLNTSDPMVARWENTVLAKGDLVEEVNRLKNKEGKDIIVYGGSNFVSNLIRHNLIDEYHLFINPTALGSGKGLPVFTERKKLSLVKAESFACGIVVLQYKTEPVE